LIGQEPVSVSFNEMGKEDFENAFDFALKKIATK